MKKKLLLGATLLSTLAFGAAPTPNPIVSPIGGGNNGVMTASADINVLLNIVDGITFELSDADLNFGTHLATTASSAQINASPITITIKGDANNVGAFVEFYIVDEDGDDDAFDSSAGTGGEALTLSSASDSVDSFIYIPTGEANGRLDASGEYNTTIEGAILTDGIKDKDIGFYSNTIAIHAKYN